VSTEQERSILNQKPEELKVGSRKWISKETGIPEQELDDYYDYLEHLTCELPLWLEIVDEEAKEQLKKDI
jgi:hypothetical protein